MSVQEITIASKRLLALSAKYCEEDKNDPMLEMNQRVNVSIMCSANMIKMRVVGVDTIVEDGDNKKIYHMICSDIVTTDEKKKEEVRAAKKALRAKLKNDIINSKYEHEEEFEVKKPVVRRLSR